VVAAWPILSRIGRPKERTFVHQLEDFELVPVGHVAAGVGRVLTPLDGLGEHLRLVDGVVEIHGAQVVRGRDALQRITAHARGAAGVAEGMAPAMAQVGVQHECGEPDGGR
jgi:hypothetical protein